MLVSGVRGIDSMFPTRTSGNSDVFSEILNDFKVKPSDKSDVVNVDNKALENDSDFQPKVTTGFFPSGQAYTFFNVEDNLTSSDKAYLKSLGWPTTGSSDLNFLASNIAQDRVDGALKGSLTKEYLFGDREKGLSGLVERMQGMGSGFSELCTTLLKTIDQGKQNS
ncbi:MULTISPECIES: hypothetical protein [Enterobacterales]|uniref:Uncharacterized protein n=1 Tax=Pectobacterium brasiliense TaxID=180957 RepID=A0A0M2EXF3_9GAMM|nr:MULTISPECIES: hypothetical protein [Enterobacterales]GKW35968.1 hypothetical protein PEC730217_47480 [Pectobacterium carotovorum subsp. carotovorum]KGA30329.1 hypothetical protein KU74_22005 [Pectobacterium brasiliense]MCL6375670.1 hypothetical protein [Pectobacterium atrosepticum]MCL6413672.1 hypothetical protein [Pantoea agglomerans]RUR87076.1 hypothetical protein PB16LOC_04524 [Pectobacterium versatile]